MKRKKKYPRKKKKFLKVDNEIKAWADILHEQKSAKREYQNRKHTNHGALMIKMLEANNAFFMELLDKI